MLIYKNEGAAAAAPLLFYKIEVFHTNDRSPPVEELAVVLTYPNYPSLLRLIKIDESTPILDSVNPPQCGIQMI